MKKTAVFLVCILILLLCGCSALSGTSSFLNEVSAGNYLKAQEIYEKSIFGNMQSEVEVEEALIKLIQDSIDSYNNGNIEYEQSYSTIATVEKVEVIDYYETQNAYYELENLKNSKAAYNAAEKLLADGYYEDAILNYSNVLRDDSNYSDAQEKIKTATSYIISEVTEKVAEMQQSKDYSGALELINKTLNSVDAEIELGALRNQISAECLNNAIDEAAAAFSNGKDYESAIKIITAAMNVIGEDSRLTAELEKYQSYIPIALTTLEPYTTTYIRITSDNTDVIQDVNGNRYTDVFYNCGNNADLEDEGKIEYYINGQYSNLCGTLYLPYLARGTESPKIPSTFKIYGDGILLYEAPKFKMGVTEPLNFSVNISNVQALKIIILGRAGTSYWSDDPVVCATNLMLSK